LSTAGATISFKPPLLTLPNGSLISLKASESNVLLVSTTETVTSKDEVSSHQFDGMHIVDDLTADVDPAAGEQTRTSPNINPALPEAWRHQIKQLNELHSRLFLPASGSELCAFPPFTVDTQQSAPIFSRPFRIPHSEREVVNAHVEKYLKKGWIVPSRSEWSSPTLIVRRNGKERFCIDYRRVNKVTIRDRFPAPSIDDCFDRLGGCKFFSLCDADAAYHQCKLAEADAHKLAFATHDGLFQPTVLLFGPMNAPAYFQRNIAACLAGVKHVFAYLDDIMIATPTWDEHVTALTETFQRLETAGVRLKPSKCHIAMPSVRYLGFVIDAAGLHTDPSKVESIVHIATPSNIARLRTFMGMCAYYQRFVSSFAELAAPLYQLLKASVPWRWESQQEHAFVGLKKAISSEPVLAIVDFKRPLELLTDASSTAIGAVLQQRDEDGNPHPIAYASRVLQPAEKNYPTQEHEGLAVIFGLLKFRTYLLGRHFTLFTDHQALLNIAHKPSPSARITRWSLAMQEYDFDVMHLPGALHVVPDALSRADYFCPVLITDDTVWRRHQAEDRFCNLTSEQLRTNSCNSDDDIGGFFISDNGVLCLQASQAQLRLVVPRTLVADVLESVHSDVMAGHQGIRRSLSRCARSYFWTGWRRDVTNFVNACKSCQQRKNPPTRQLPKLHVRSTGPNDLVAMDLQGPLNITPLGNQYILVIQDIFTKFVVATPLIDASADAVSRIFLAFWVGPFGVPARLLTDNGSNFTSDLMADLFIVLRIQKIWTSPYHPQTDGSVERFNRTLNNMVSHFVNDRQDNWDSVLPLLALAYNSTFNTTVNNSPFFLWYGREAPTVASLLAHIPAMDQASYGEGLKLAMKSALAAAYNNIIQRQNQSDVETANINNSAQFQECSVGEEELILDKTTPPGQ